MGIERLAFEVVACSGFDDEFHPSQVVPSHNNASLAKGWQSPRFCTWPQYLVLRLEKLCRIRKIQILSHHFKISERVDLFVGDTSSSQGQENGPVQFQLLGYVNFSDNVKAGYKARELKTVHIDAQGNLIKLSLRKCHINPLNLYNQAGIVAINVLGEVIDTEYVSRIMGDATRLKYGIDFAGDENIVDPYTRGLINRTHPYDTAHDISTVSAEDKSFRDLVRSVQMAKDMAVRDEDFTAAKQLKMLLAVLDKAEEEITKMEVAKVNAVKDEDYDTAEYIKQDISRIKTMVFSRLEAMGFEMDSYGSLVKKHHEHVDPESAMRIAMRDTTVSVNNERVIDKPKGELSLNVPMGNIEEARLNAGQTRATSSMAERQSRSVSRATKAPDLKTETVQSAPTVTQPESSRSPKPVQPKTRTTTTEPLRTTGAAESNAPVLKSLSRATTNNGDLSNAIPEFKPLRVTDDLPLKAPSKPYVEEAEPILEAPEPAPMQPKPVRQKAKSTEPRKAITSPNPPSSPPPPRERVISNKPERRLEEELSPVLTTSEPKSFPAGLDKPEPMTPRDADEWSISIAEFGELTIRALFSKQFKHREWAMEEVDRALNDKASELNEEKVSAGLQVAAKALAEDSREKVSMASLGILKNLINEITNQGHLEWSGFYKVFDNIVPNVLIRCAENNPRIRQASEEIIRLLLESCPGYAFSHLLKSLPKKPPIWRQIKARIDLITNAIIEFGIDEAPKTKKSAVSQFGVERIMDFVKPQFNHTNGEVRDSCANVVFELCVLVGKKRMEQYLREMKTTIAQGILNKLDQQKHAKAQQRQDEEAEEEEPRPRSEARSVRSEAVTAKSVTSSRPKITRSTSKASELRSDNESEPPVVQRRSNDNPRLKRSQVLSRSPSPPAPAPASTSMTREDVSVTMSPPRSRMSVRSDRSSVLEGINSKNAGNPEDDEPMSQSPPPEAQKPPKPKKKRRFLRLFGLGEHDEDENAKSEDKNVDSTKNERRITSSSSQAMSGIASPVTSPRSMSRARLDEIDDKARQAKQKPPIKPSEAMSNNWNIDRMCIFCDETNDAFTEETLDLHYWKDCPMLTNCPLCNAVVEISALTEHMSRDCERRSSVKVCDTCKLTFAPDALKAHQKQGCRESNTPLCPLCAASIPGGDMGWKKHLLVYPGCPKNKRKMKQAPTTEPAIKSKIPLPTSPKMKSKA